MQRSRSNLSLSLSMIVASMGVASMFSGCLRTSSNCEDDGIDCPATAGAGGTVAGSAGKGGGGKGGSAGYAQGGSIAGEAGQTNGGAGVGGGGAMGGEGGMGGTASLPCDGICKTPTPVCDETNDKCVQCLDEQDCTTGSKTKCNDANACVQCIDATTDCLSVAAARCDGGECVKCVNNDDCAHISGKGVCDNGTCVQCTVADETPCAGKSCDPQTKACTATTLGSVATCKPCIADSECTGGNQGDPDARCVSMDFQGSARPGGFCLRREVKTCARPYATIVTKSSLSGALSDGYCGIDQDNVTCEAVLDLIGDADGTESCADGNDTSCGCARDQNDSCVGTGKGGLCRKVGAFTNRCTYQCGTGDDCPTGKTCAGSPTTYCQ